MKALIETFTISLSLTTLRLRLLYCRAIFYFPSLPPHLVTGRQGRTTGRPPVLHLNQDQIDGPRGLPDGPDRIQDSATGWAGVVGGVLDAPVQHEQRALGRHGRDRHHGGEFFFFCSIKWWCEEVHALRRLHGCISLCTRFFYRDLSYHDDTRVCHSLVIWIHTARFVTFDTR